MAALCLFPVFAQDHSRKIDDLVSAYHQLDQFNGSALVAEKGKVIFRKGYGLANRELDVPNEPGTKFRLGSITKQFTATLVLQLVELGKIRLDARITDYVPEYPKDTGNRVSVHHLLCHQSGIPSYTKFPGFFGKPSRVPFAPLELAKIFWDKPLEFPPGSQYAYDNSGYHLLGIIVEKVTGKSYEAVLAERTPSTISISGTRLSTRTRFFPQNRKS